ncbi:Nicotinate dehydrogenase small FeS subunit [uncultured Desulfobacterium sp.]|uniref:Nicotinate dehydrogenase small FeS subunit n=1 Tax=uncultured Desulfobacterium sp. TaxID=201089 RepID=A0A445N0W4_9BACT|nr:Nicotinate dehydrogenase small FeS subunit [uncultured Desulfobacterium sp.]
MKKKFISLMVNGESYDVAVHPHQTLLEVLREQLGLTGTKEGCGKGACGACTVLIDGEATLACLTLVLSVEGKSIITVEGLARAQELTPLQESFVEHGAIQCGFCTPGMLMASTALLSKNPQPDEGAVQRAISGNLCRCTGYVKIVEAVVSATKAT